MNELFIYNADIFQNERTFPIYYIYLSFFENKPIAIFIFKAFL
jgi:hypothetical protein